MTITFVLDDTVEVPQDIAALTGIARYGALLHKRWRLASRLLDAAERAGMDTMHLVSRNDLRALDERVADRDVETRYLYVPASLAPTSADRLSGFLQKLRYAEDALVLRPEARASSPALYLLPRDAFRALLRALARQRPIEDALAGTRLEAIPNEPAFADISDYRTFLGFLTGTFETRAFNEIRQGDWTIEKRSADKAKMKKEHDYWYLLPPSLQPFFVQPYGYAEDAAGASYRMERLAMPDMAIQWVHGAVVAEDFARFLDRVFAFLAARPERSVAPAEARRVADALYRDKLVQRIESLKALPLYGRLSSVLAGSRLVSLDRLIERYEALYAGMRHEDETPRLAIGHGDLCFSNILWDKRTGMMKLIDPRGAVEEKDLWTDRYYDVAKLSHSVLGRYDFVNNGLFDLAYDEGLELRLELDGEPLPEAEDLFRTKLEAYGFDYARVRLYEASLFLSMVPLHAENPKKIVGFLMTADRILSELEERAGRRIPSWLTRLGGA